MNKQQKRKMKVLELTCKADYQYYLYQLICRTYKMIRQQDIYLERFNRYLEEKQRAHILQVTSSILVPYEEYRDYLALLGYVEMNLLNIIGDLQGSSMSYYKFRQLYSRHEKNLDFRLEPLCEEINSSLKLFNMSRNFQNHMPESLITVERELINNNGVDISNMNPLFIVNDESCTLEYDIDLYNTYKAMNTMAKDIFEMMKKDMAVFLGKELDIIEICSDKPRCLDDLEPVKQSASIKGLN